MCVSKETAVSFNNRAFEGRCLVGVYRRLNEGNPHLEEVSSSAAYKKVGRLRELATLTLHFLRVFTMLEQLQQPTLTKKG